MDLSRLEIDGIKRGLSEKTIWKYKNVFKAVQLVTGRTVDILTEKDLEAVFLSFYKDDRASDTKIGEWKVFKKLVRLYNPALLKPLQEYKLRDKQKIKKPEEILTINEINSMLSEARTQRIKTIISVLYESGMRNGEFIGLKVKDVIFDEYGAILSVDGKTGSRQVRIVKSVQTLKEYLKYHMFKNDPNAPLFYRADKMKPTPLSYTAVNEIVKETARFAGIQKRVHTYIMRHSRATHMAKFLKEHEMRLFFGWSHRSPMPSVYVHLSGRDIDERVLEINGIIPEKRLATSLKI